MALKETIKNLPDSPGVYIFKDIAGKIIYIGKAGSLKRRILSYFAKTIASPKTEALILNIASVDFIFTKTEAEALIYEASLVKEHQPKYNVDLKDDKRYPLLKLTLNEEYPRLMIVRQQKDDGALNRTVQGGAMHHTVHGRAKYYGRYTSAKLLRQALSYMRKAFPLRTCKTFPKSACLNYHIGQCIAPCIEKSNKDQYAKIVKELQLFLEGKKDLLIKDLTGQMEEESKNKNFENAAQLRDRIRALSFVYDKDAFEIASQQLQQIKKILRLDVIPRRIDAFDISNIYGTHAVGSMVSFYEGRPDKENYRRFRIKTVEKIDDYMMLKEVLIRRLKRIRDEKLPFPNLIIIDGGKGHLNTAKNTLEEFGLSKIPVISIAKRFEEIFVIGRKAPLKLPGNSKALQLIMRIRDEAHRFAISYHHRIRSWLTTESLLDEIPGIGPKRKKELIAHFGSINDIRNASVEDLKKAVSIDEKTAKTILNALSRKGI